MGADRWDFVIVGGGSAGCALANRLSADPDNRVLLLEAGRTDSRWDTFIHMPAALTFPIGSRFYDWKYESEPEPHMNGRRIYHARGKVLGGSSSINGMIFQRGNPLDYERWAGDPGMQDWDYAHCLPYFRRMENCLAAAPDDPFRGHDGPLVLERGPATNPLFEAFFSAAEEAGYARTPDVNGYRQEGFGPFDRNVHRGRRLSAARAYLHPVMGRSNLSVWTRALVQRVLFDGTRATGVEVRLRGAAPRRIAAGQVLLCGGAINTPQLLQLSGVGPAAELEGLGVPVLADRPAVGANLQDHLEVYIQYASKQPVTMQRYTKLRYRPYIGARWLFLRSGPGATNHFEGGGFARSNDNELYPNLMFHFLPIAIRYDGSAPAGGEGYQVHIGPMYSDARGTVLITSTDPRDKPALRFNYLSTEQDRREWVEAIHVARTILNQPALAPYNGGEISPGDAVQTDEEIMEWVARDAETALHPSCTARMGTDDNSAVDPATMSVHGLDGLRVVDASVMPYVTNGNIYAPVMMTAEKAADLILGNTPLPPESVEFFRRRAGSDRGEPVPETATDAGELAEFGYKQELDRSLGKFSSFAAGFSYLSILTGVFQLFGFGFAFGGPAYWWSWPVVFIGQGLVALCFAELAGRYPLAGSVYQWSKQLASPVVSWFAGWIILIGAIVTVAAVAVAWQVVLPQISHKFEFIGTSADAGTYLTPGGAKNAIILALILVIFTTIVNLIGVKLMARINNFGVMVELIGACILVVLLMIHIKRGPGVITHTNGTGAGHSWGYFGAFLIAALASTYIFYGFDTAGSLAEETNNPRGHAPGAIIRAIAAAGVIGGILILFALMAQGHIYDSKTIAAINAEGLPYIVKSVLGTGLGDVFLACSAIAIAVCALAVHTAGIRIMFTMARDGRLPLGSTVARVSGKSRTPLVPAIVIGVLTVVLLLVNIGNQQAFLVLTSVAIILFYLAYLLVTGPLLYRRLRREWPRADHGPYFSLGRWGLLVNVVAVIYQTVIVVNLAWPRASVYGGTHWYFQWGAFVFIGLVVVVGGLYYLGAQRGRIAEVLAEHRALPTTPSEALP